MHMKKILIIIACVLLMIACREELIPTVSVEMSAPEVVALGADTVFDTISYHETSRDIDTIRIDTFFVDSIRLCASVSYTGDEPYAPTLTEYGFCRVSDTLFLPVFRSTDPQKKENNYGAFSCVIQAKSNEQLYVYAYADNPFGRIQSYVRLISMPELDPRLK